MNFNIVAKHKDYLVLVEARIKTSLKLSSPEESVTDDKKKRLITTAINIDRPMIIYRCYGVLILWQQGWAKRTSYHILSLWRMQ